MPDGRRARPGAAEGREVPHPHERLGGRAHRVDVERPPGPQGPVGAQGVAQLGAVDDPIAVAPPQRAEPRVEAWRRDCHRPDHDVGRQHTADAGEQRLLARPVAPTLELDPGLVRDVDVRDLPPGVHASVGASRHRQTDPGAQDLGETVFEGPLDRPQPGLDGPAGKVCPPVGDVESDAHHVPHDDARPAAGRTPVGPAPSGTWTAAAGQRQRDSGSGSGTRATLDGGTSHHLAGPQTHHGHSDGRILHLMSASGSPAPLTLSVDCGGGGIKAAVLDAAGTAHAPAVRVPTPYPLSPELLVDTVAGLARGLPPADRVSLGMPGMIRHGVVIHTPHYITRTGPRSRIDPELRERWSGFDARAALERRLGVPVLVLNDAEIHGAGVVAGTGLEPRPDPRDRARQRALRRWPGRTPPRGSPTLPCGAAPPMTPTSARSSGTGSGTDCGRGASPVSSTVCGRCSCGTGSTSAEATRAGSPRQCSTGWVTRSSSCRTRQPSWGAPGPGTSSDSWCDRRGRDGGCRRDGVCRRTASAPPGGLRQERGGSILGSLRPGAGASGTLLPAIPEQLWPT